MKKVCAETRGLARFYREYSRLTYRKIAAKCGTSKSTAHRVCDTKREHCEYMCPIEGSSKVPERGAKIFT